MTKESSGPKMQESEFIPKSDLLKWFCGLASIVNSNANLLIHSPLYTSENSLVVKDFNDLQGRYKGAYTIWPMNFEGNIIDNINKDLPSDRRTFRYIFIEGVLEHIQNHMVGALLIRKLISMLDKSTSSYIMLHTLSTKHVDVVSHELPQLCMHGIDNNEITAFMAYARLNSILMNRTDILKDYEDSFIILSDGQ